MQIYTLKWPSYWPLHLFSSVLHEQSVRHISFEFLKRNNRLLSLKAHDWDTYLLTLSRSVHCCKFTHIELYPINQYKHWRNYTFLTCYSWMMLWNLVLTKEERKSVVFDISFPAYFNHFYTYGHLCSGTFATPSYHQETDIN